MKYFYDTEFYEDGKIINLISIGVVCEDGREYYAINKDTEHEGILDSAWLIQNVLPHLPTFKIREKSPHGWGNTLFNYRSPLYKCRGQIKDELLEFVRGSDIELWGFCSAYDHVALCQLFGPMVNLPKHWPYFTNDLKQVLGRKQMPIPPDPAKQHHALEDARWTKQNYEQIFKTLAIGPTQSNSVNY